MSFVRFWSRFKTQDTTGKVKMGKMCGMERAADGFIAGSQWVWDGSVMGTEWVCFRGAGGDFCNLRVCLEAFSNDFLQF